MVSIKAIKRDTILLNKSKWQYFVISSFLYVTLICLLLYIFNIINDRYKLISNNYFDLYNLYSFKSFYFILFISFLNLLLSPIIISFKRVLLNNIKNEFNFKEDMFFYFKNKKIMFRVYNLYFYKFIKKWCLYIVIITTINFWFNSFYKTLIFSNRNNGNFKIYIGVIFLLLFYLIFSIRYILNILKFINIDYLFIENPTMTNFEYFKRSEYIFTRNYNEILNLFISFVPIVLTSIFIIPIFFIIPYFLTSTAILFKIKK